MTRVCIDCGEAYVTVSCDDCKGRCKAGVAPSIRMALGGHSTASMALHYIDHASVEDVRRALGA